MLKVIRKRMFIFLNQGIKEAIHFKNNAGKEMAKQSRYIS